MGRHRAALQDMPSLAGALCRRISKDSGLTPHQLERIFGIGLRSWAYEVAKPATGHKLRRDVTPTNGSRWSRICREVPGQGLSESAFSEILTKAMQLGRLRLSIADKFALGVAGDGRCDLSALAKAATAQRNSLELYEAGLSRMGKSKMPISRGGQQGGAPAKPRDAQEMHQAIAQWESKVRRGCLVHEDSRCRAMASSLAYFLGDVTDVEYRVIGKALDTPGLEIHLSEQMALSESLMVVLPPFPLTSTRGGEMADCDRNLQTTRKSGREEKP